MKQATPVDYEPERLPPEVVKAMKSLIAGQDSCIGGALPLVGLVFIVPLIRGYRLMKRYPMLAKGGPYDRVRAARLAAIEETLLNAGFTPGESEKWHMTEEAYNFLEMAIENATAPPLNLTDEVQETIHLIFEFRSAMTTYWLGLFLFPILTMIAFAFVVSLLAISFLIGAKV